MNRGLAIVCPSFLARVGEARPGLSLEHPTSPYAAFSVTGWSVISDIEIDPNDDLRIYVSDENGGIFVSDKGSPWYEINQGLLVKKVLDLALSSDGSVLYAATRGAGVYRLVLDRPLAGAR